MPYMDVRDILQAVYEIQGCSDPGDSPDTLAERMERIREIADRVMDVTAFDPA